MDKADINCGVGARVQLLNSVWEGRNQRRALRRWRRVFGFGGERRSGLGRVAAGFSWLTTSRRAVGNLRFGRLPAPFKKLLEILHHLRHDVEFFRKKCSG